MGIGLDVPIHHAERLQHTVLSTRESWRPWKQSEKRSEGAVGSVRLVVFAMVEIRPAAGTALDLLRAAAHVFVAVRKGKKRRAAYPTTCHCKSSKSLLHCIV